LDDNAWAETYPQVNHWQNRRPSKFLGIMLNPDLQQAIRPQQPSIELRLRYGLNCSQENSKDGPSILSSLPTDRLHNPVYNLEDDRSGLIDRCVEIFLSAAFCFPQMVIRRGESKSQ